MKAYLAATIIALSALPALGVSKWIVSDDGRSLWATNCTFHGGNVIQETMQTVIACESICASTAECTHWAWSDGNCVHLKGYSGAATYLDHANCGFVVGRYQLPSEPDAATIQASL
uniref:Apple domain-containing protein n=1 Tax=Globisporangium ultimum (strain ATCC 200006 / CBS 805.95 / DAOM BR144) TaxID=431595 RepID=K3WZS0_GLOUD